MEAECKLFGTSFAVPGGKIVISQDKRLIEGVSRAVFDFENENGVGDRLKSREYTGDDGATEGVFVLTPDNALAGGVTIHIHLDWVWLHSGFVWPEYRGKGVYSECVRTIECMAEGSGLSGLFVSTYEWEVPTVYEALGFKKGAVLHNLPRGNTSIDYFKELRV